jgi:hypothetical protein
MDVVAVRLVETRELSDGGVDLLGALGKPIGYHIELDRLPELGWRVRAKDEDRLRSEDEELVDICDVGGSADHVKDVFESHPALDRAAFLRADRLDADVLDVGFLDIAAVSASTVARSRANGWF